MPYVAQRKTLMGGQWFAPPGNSYDLPHIIPSELVERTPHRALGNMLTRGVIRQMETVPEVTTGLSVTGNVADLNLNNTVTTTDGAAPGFAGFDSNPRVQNEGSGWYKVDGNRVHGRKGVEKALELGG